MSLLIGDNQVVSIHYTLTNNDGEVIDSSREAEPLSYLHGAGNIIPGLEEALVGKSEGTSVSATVEPEKAYGETLNDLIQVVDRTAFHGVDDIQPGMAFEAEGEGGAAQYIVVKEIDGDEITIDANHPLAGQTLNFAVEVISIRGATAEELEHGHSH